MGEAKPLKTIFLSAGIPGPEGKTVYRETMDPAAIRDAVAGMGAAVLPRAKLIWAGHPAITPLIREAVVNLNVPIKERAVLYQSRFFEGEFPEDNPFFEGAIRYTDGVAGNRAMSLAAMRKTMLNNHPFAAGVFIGGMEGVEEEFDLFREIHPDAPVLPVASTGAAARLLFDKYVDTLHLSASLADEYDYHSLFSALLPLD